MPARLASVERAWESKILQMSREFAGWWLFFGGLSQINKPQHFYHLLRNRSCHQQSFSSKVLKITCYSCEEKLTFYRTLKRFSHMLLIQSANKTMQSRRFAKFKWHNFIASLYWLTKLDVHTRDSFPNIPHPWCYDFDLMRSFWGKVVNMRWMIQLGKFQICSLLWWTAIVPCQEVAKEYNRPLKSNKNPLPSAWQIGCLWRKRRGDLPKEPPRLFDFT